MQALEKLAERLPALHDDLVPKAMEQGDFIAVVEQIRLSAGVLIRDNVGLLFQPYGEVLRYVLRLLFIELDDAVKNWEGLQAVLQSPKDASALTNPAFLRRASELTRRYNLGDVLRLPSCQVTTLSDFEAQFLNRSAHQQFVDLLISCANVRSLAAIGQELRLEPREIATLKRAQDGRTLPSPASRHIFAKFFAHCRKPEGIRLFDVAISEDINPTRRATRHALPQLSSAHEAEFSRLIKHDNEAPKKMRGGSGARDVEEDLAESTEESYHHYVKIAVAAATLTPNKSLPQLSGLGRTADTFHLFEIGFDAEFEAANCLIAARGARRPKGREDAPRLHKLADWYAPVDGSFFRDAEYWAGFDTVVARCPNTWPPNTPLAGTACENEIQRIQAACYAIHRKLSQAARRADKAPCSVSWLGELAVLMAEYNYPRVGVCRLIHRLHAFLINQPLDRRSALWMAVLAVLALEIWRPPRPGEIQWFRFHQKRFDFDADHPLILRFPKTEKNWASIFGASFVAPVPRELKKFFRPWLKKGRPFLAPRNDTTAFFLNSRGGALSPEVFRRTLDDIIALMASDIFPDGIRPHFFRHIVAADFIAHWGQTEASKFIPPALRKSPEGSLADYCIIRFAAPFSTQLQTEEEIMAWSLRRAAELESGAAPHGILKRAREAKNEEMILSDR